MNICLAQVQSIPGNIAANIDQHRHWIAKAAEQAADLIIFPELSLTGYEPTMAKALAMDPADARLAVFQEDSHSFGLTIGVGLPTITAGGICISLVIFQPQGSRLVYSKQYLHPDEEPFFVPGENIPVLAINHTKIGFAICYELSVPAHAAMALAAGAEVYLASVAKSANGMDNAAERMAGIAQSYAVSTAIVNSLGPGDDFIGVGRSAFWDAHGNLLNQLEEDEEDLLLFTIPA